MYYYSKKLKHPLPETSLSLKLKPHFLVWNIKQHTFFFFFLFSESLFSINPFLIRPITVWTVLYNSLILSLASLTIRWSRRSMPLPLCSPQAHKCYFLRIGPLKENCQDKGKEDGVMKKHEVWVQMWGWGVGGGEVKRTCVMWPLFRHRAVFPS